MVARLRKYTLAVGAFAWLAGAMPLSPAAFAQDGQDQRWSHRPPPRPMGPSISDDCRGLHGRDRVRCDRDRDRRGWRHRERERERRKDAKTDGIVAGVVGAAIVGGVIAAIGSDNRKKKERRERRRYCLDRYGNYDARTDSYRARDGRFYPCE